MSDNTLLPVESLKQTNFWTTKEMAELPALLLAQEKVLAILSGVYEGGMALLCITSQRLLLVDKKLFRLTIEDIRFDALKSLDYIHQPFLASLRFFAAGRELVFRSWYRSELRMLSQLVQQKMADDKSEAPLLPSQERIKRPQSKQPVLARALNWRQSSRLVEGLMISRKAGKQIVGLATPVRR